MIKENLLGQVDWSQDYKYYYLKTKKNEIPNEEAREQIKEKYEKYKNYLSKITNKDINVTLDDLKEKIKKCEEEERKIAETLQISNEYNLAERKGKQIKFWTNYFIFGKATIDDLNKIKGKEDYSSKFLFRLILSSKEFGLKIRSQTGQQELSKKKYLKSKGLENFTVKQSEEEIIKDLDNKESILWKNTEKAFKQAFEDEKKFCPPDLIENLQIIYNLVSDSIKTKKSFEIIKKIFRNGINDLLNKYAKEEGESHLNIDKLQINAGENLDEPFFLTVSVFKTGIYGKVKKENKNEDLTTIIQKSIIRTIEELKGNKQLDLMSAGVIQIDNDYLFNFYENAINYAKSEQLKYIINQILGGKKSLDEIGGITGIIGELIGLFAFKSKMDIQHSGAKKDIGKLFNGEKIDFGESFADLSGEITNVNIKHYISSDNVLELYAPKKDQEGLAILGRKIARYIPLEQLAIMRFLEANYKYVCQILKMKIERNSLLNSFVNIGVVNLDNFLRQSGVVSNVNVGFYQLNNLIVPSSKIYEVILNNAKGNKDWKKKLISIKDGQDGYDIYKTKPKKENNNFLLQNYYSETKGAKMLFNGLKVNLRELSPFIKGK